MHIIPLAHVGPVGTQLLGAHAFSFRLVDCELIIPILAIAVVEASETCSLAVCGSGLATSEGERLSCDMVVR